MIICTRTQHSKWRDHYAIMNGSRKIIVPHPKPSQTTVTNDTSFLQLLYLGTCILLTISWYLFLATPISWYLFLATPISWYLHLATYILVPTSCYLYLGTYILLTISWYLHLVNYILVPTSCYLYLGTYILLTISWHFILAIGATYTHTCVLALLSFCNCRKMVVPHRKPSKINLNTNCKYDQGLVL